MRPAFAPAPVCLARAPFPPLLLRWWARCVGFCLFGCVFKSVALPTLLQIGTFHHPLLQISLKLILNSVHNLQKVQQLNKSNGPGGLC